jgi:integrase
VAASTQTQALNANALVFLYDTVLAKSLGHLGGLKRVQKRFHVPVVLTREEVRAVLALMHGTPKFMVELLYGAGLRVTECVTLRVKDIDFGAHAITVRCGKDRTTVLPEQVVPALQQLLLGVVTLHKRDVAQGAVFAPLPVGLGRKYPSASRSLAWQFVSPLIARSRLAFIESPLGAASSARAWCSPSAGVLPS